MKPILVTGASGNTGSRIVRALSKRDQIVRTLIRKSNLKDRMISLGAAEVVYGDMYDDQSLLAAINNSSIVIHICPPMNPDESEIAMRIIEHCISTGLERLILYSVLHPLISGVPHHQNKLNAERALVESGQKYTILQPSRYMQHLTPIWQDVVVNGVLNMPFSVNAKLSVVDLNDVADAVASIAIQDNHDQATYQLAGPEPLSQIDMAKHLSELLGKQITARSKSLPEFRRDSKINGLPPFRIKNMIKMNKHYDEHGLVGNSNILEWILKRPATTFREYVQRDLMAGKL